MRLRRTPKMDERAYPDPNPLLSSRHPHPPARPGGRDPIGSLISYPDHQAMAPATTFLPPGREGARGWGEDRRGVAGRGGTYLTGFFQSRAREPVSGTMASSGGDLQLRQTLLQPRLELRRQPPDRGPDGASGIGGIGAAGEGLPGHPNIVRAVIKEEVQEVAGLVEVLGRLGLLGDRPTGR